MCYLLVTKFCFLVDLALEDNPTQFPILLTYNYHKYHVLDINDLFKGILTSGIKLTKLP